MTEQPEAPQTEPASPAENPKAPEPTKEPTAPAAETGDDQLGDTGVKALKAERKKRADAEKLATDSAEKVTELTKRVIVAELGLTPEQAALLRGDTEEELKAHASEMQAAFTPAEAPRRPTERLKPGGVPGTEPGQSASEAAEEALRY